MQGVAAEEPAPPGVAAVPGRVTAQIAEVEGALQVDQSLRDGHGTIMPRHSTSPAGRIGDMDVTEEAPVSQSMPDIGDNGWAGPGPVSSPPLMASPT